MAQLTLLKGMWWKKYAKSLAALRTETNARGESECRVPVVGSGTKERRHDGTSERSKVKERKVRKQKRQKY